MPCVLIYRPHRQISPLYLRPLNHVRQATLDDGGLGGPLRRRQPGDGGGDGRPLLEWMVAAWEAPPRMVAAWEVPQ